MIKEIIKISKKKKNTNLEAEIGNNLYFVR